MVYRRISPDKQRVLQLLQDGWEIDEITGVLQVAVSGKSITCQKDKHEEYGDVAPQSSNRSRRHILNHEMLNDLRSLIAETLLDEPRSADIHQRTLAESPERRVHIQDASAEQNSAAREAWMDNFTHYGADQLVFLDESSKDECTIFCRYGRSLAGERAVRAVPSDRGTRYISLALTLEGYIAIRVTEGSIDGAEFYDFVIEDVLPKASTSAPGIGRNLRHLATTDSNRLIVAALRRETEDGVDSIWRRGLFLMLP